MDKDLGCGIHLVDDGNKYPLYADANNTTVFTIYLGDEPTEDRVSYLWVDAGDGKHYQYAFDPNKETRSEAEAKFTEYLNGLKEK